MERIIRAPIFSRNDFFSIRPEFFPEFFPGEFLSRPARKISIENRRRREARGLLTRGSVRERLSGLQVTRNHRRVERGEIFRERVTGDFLGERAALGRFRGRPRGDFRASGPGRFLRDRRCSSGKSEHFFRRRRTLARRRPAAIRPCGTRCERPHGDPPPRRSRSRRRMPAPPTAARESRRPRDDESRAPRPRSTGAPAWSATPVHCR